MFGDDITLDDLIFDRDGASADLTIGIEGSTDTVDRQPVPCIPHRRLRTLWLYSVDQFVFADGTSISGRDLAQLIIDRATTAGNDTAYGYHYEDVFRSSAGDDFMSGGNANDKYYYALGAGHDTIKDGTSNFSTGMTDTVYFDKGVVLSETIFSRDGGSNDLVVEFSDGGSLTIEGQFSAIFTGVFGNLWADRIEYFVFTNANGTTTTLTSTQVMAKLLEDGATSGNDELHGFAWEDVLDGGAGDDFLSGKQEGDTYIFGRGYGHDTIQDNEGSYVPEGSNIDRVVFLPDVAPEDIIISRSGANDMVLTIEGTSDVLTLSGQVWYHTINYYPDQIEEFVFDDETVWTAADLRALYLERAGTSGAETITGFYTNDVLDGGAGNDILRGGDGADIYIFGRGSGNDRIEESVGFVTYSDADRVSFGPDIELEDLLWSRDGNDLIITIDDTSETLTIAGHFNVSAYFTWQEIEYFDFADQTTLTKLQANQITPGASQHRRRRHTARNIGARCAGWRRWQ